MPIASVNGVELYYEVHGSGKPLFLTHGSWGDATVWQAVLPGLAERFEVIIWDRRGHSRSSDGDGPGSLHEDAADLAALVEHLDRRGAHVHGSSAGGIVVLNMVLARPELIARAAVHEPPVMDMLGGVPDPEIAGALADQQTRFDRVRTLIEAGESGEAAEYFFDTVAVGPGAWERFPEPVRAGIVANAPTYADELSHPGAWTVDTEALGVSEVPTMVTLGTESPPLILAATRELIRRTPSAHAKTLEGSGHVPYRTHRALWLETLMGFFET